MINNEKIEKIAALEPCYGDRGGNSTRIYTTEGEVFVDDRRLPSLVKSIGRGMSADLQSMRQNYGAHLDCGQGVPLVFTAKCILTAVKMRIPLSPYDGATGYVNYPAYIDVEEVKDPEEGKPKCFILTKGGHRLPSFFLPEYTKKQFKQAERALIYYYHLHGDGSKISAELEWLKRFWDFFNPPTGPGFRA